MIYVQNYLLKASLSDLLKNYGIKSSANPGDSFWSLNYDQIDSKPGPLENQCRGLILGTSPMVPLNEDQVNGSEPIGATQILARSFDRFFNFGDTAGAAISLSDPATVFFEKLDGTCCIVWYHPELKVWNVATRMVPLANKPMSGWGEMTFRKLFEKALGETIYSNKKVVKDGTFFTVFDAWSATLDPRFTYIFELTTPVNRIVVAYEEFRIHLIGMRNTETGEEVRAEDVKIHGVNSCPVHKLNNEKELMAFVGSKPPFEQEGIVIRDNQFNRLKVKSLAYIAYNRLRDRTANSPRAIMELILAKKLDDVLPILEPWLKTRALEMQIDVNAYFQELDEEFLEIKEEVAGSVNERKEFALIVQEREIWMAPLMERFLGKCTSSEDYIQKKQLATGGYPDPLMDSLINRAVEIKSL